MEEQIMKKTYITPLVEVDGMETEQMICESVKGFDKHVNPDATVDGGSVLGKDDDYDFSDNLW